MNATYIIESVKHDIRGVFAMIVNTKTNTATEIFFTYLNDAHTYIGALNKISA